AAVMFVLALCFATTNGWWYVSSYGVPFNSSMPKIGGISISTIFFALFVIIALYAARLHFADTSHGECRLARALTAAPIPLAAGFMALVFVASMTAGIVRQYPTYSNAWDNLREFSGGCGLADDVLVEPDSNAGFMAPLKTGEPDNYGPLGPLGGVSPTGFTPNGVPDRTLAEAVRETAVPQPGTDYDWYGPTKLKAPGINGSTVPLPYGLDPQRVPLAGSYTTGAQQQSRLTSAWYQLPKADAGHPLVVVTAAGTIAGDSILHHHTNGQTVVLEFGKPGPGGSVLAAGRLTPYDLYGEQRRVWRNLRFARSQRPADAVAVRVVAEDLSLTLDDWIAVTPPRVPELRSLQEYVGATQPVLMTGPSDWPSPANSRCCTSTASPRSRSSASPRTTTPRNRTPTPGRTASTVACWASPTCCCGRTSCPPTCPMTGAATGAPCVSSTPWSMPSQPSWISAPPPTSAGGRP